MSEQGKPLSRLIIAPIQRTQSDLTDKLSDEAQQALSFAQQEALSLGHDYVGPEHLLLGLMRVREGATGKVLADCGITIDGIRSAVAAAEPYDAGPFADANNPKPNPSVQEVIKYGWQWARKYDQYETETEHLLIGLTQPGVGLIRRFLEAVGTTPAAVNAAAMDAASRSAARSRPEGAELRLWGTRDDIDRLLAVAGRLNRPIDGLIWEAVRRTWLAEDDGPATTS